MTGLERLQSWFDSGQLVRPSAEELNFVDLVRALGRLAGAEGVEEGPGVQRLCREISPAEHYVFVLVDGLGIDLLERLPPESFLRSHLAARLQTVFLSATATALTTLATGQWPCRAGVPGWWAYLEEFGITAITLPFRERSTGKPLTEFGVSVEDVFPIAGIRSTLKHEPLTVLPTRIADTTYAKYSSAGTARAAYAGLPNAIAIVTNRVLSAEKPSYTYLYLPDLDAALHKKGKGDQRVHQLLVDLDAILGGLAKTLSGRARIVISADHGQVDVPAEQRFILPADDPLRSQLHCQPTGEPSVPIFHVLPGREEHFAAEFNERFGEYFALVTPAEIEQLRLLGPEALSPIMKRRLGAFVGIAPKPAKFYIHPCFDCAPENVGVHGGLTAEEMYVPLILA